MHAFIRTSTYSHVNSGAPDEAAVRARLGQLQSAMLARMAALLLTTSVAHLAETIYRSYLGPAPGFLDQQFLGCPSGVASAQPNTAATDEPPAGYWRWLVQQMRLTGEQVRLGSAALHGWVLAMAPADSDFIVPPVCSGWCLKRAMCRWCLDHAW